jgi:hypothetical protein
VDQTPPPQVFAATSHLTTADHWDHILARWGYRRGDHRITPGLYALGAPDPDAPVFVTANYTLSFDALRSALAGIDGYILVLETFGVNVWCAAGKGTFGTDELVHRIEATHLQDHVAHRRLILPQLGAPGVAAHEVKQRTGFTVEYGPVRAEEIPTYLENHVATPAMRQVRFTLRDRLVLIPIELVHVVAPLLVGTILLALLQGALSALAVIAAVLAGAALFPILLPWLPTRDFSSKGFVLGALVTLPFAAAQITMATGYRGWSQWGQAAALLLALPPVTAYLALNFTGSTTFTSKSGVKYEMATYIPIMAGLFGAGVILTTITTIWRWAA